MPTLTRRSPRSSGKKSGTSEGASVAVGQKRPLSTASKVPSNRPKPSAVEKDGSHKAAKTPRIEPLDSAKLPESRSGTSTNSTLKYGNSQNAKARSVIHTELKKLGEQPRPTVVASATSEKRKIALDSAQKHLTKVNHEIKTLGVDAAVSALKGSKYKKVPTVSAATGFRPVVNVDGVYKSALAELKVVSGHLSPTKNAKPSVVKEKITYLHVKKQAGNEMMKKATMKELVSKMIS